VFSRYIILDKDEPTKIIQRGSGQFMVPKYEYETLCDNANGLEPGSCPYTGGCNAHGHLGSTYFAIKLRIH